MPATKFIEYLDSQGVAYTRIRHPKAYTAQEIAAVAHVSGDQLAKTVMVKVDGKMAMAVLPASSRVDMDLLKDVTGASSIELASEKEFKDMFPACEVGAMPPFGILYDMDVYVSEVLTEDEEIAFNAGSHTELVRMAYADFERLVRPKVAQLSPGM